VSPKRIAIFEEIGSTFYPIVKKYLSKGFTIYFFSIENRHNEKPESKKYLEAGNLIDISRMIFEYVPVFRQASFYAHENVDYIFDKYFSSTPSIKNMEKLLEFPEIGNMYKYRLLMELEKIYVTQLKINEIAKTIGDVEEGHFYPSNNFRIHSDKSSLLLENIRVIDNNGFGRRLNKVLTRINRTVRLYYPVHLLLKKVRGISSNKRAKEFKIGISVHIHARVFAMKYWFIETVLVDDAELPKNDVLFIDERGKKHGNLELGAGISEPNSKDYEKRGYNYTNLPDDREIISSNLFWQKLVKRFIPTWLKSIFLSFWEQPLIVDTNYSILWDYIRWNVFADSYKIDNYVRSLNPDSISKIHILSQYNVKTWFIYADNTSADYVVDWDATKRNQTYYSFMYYDNIVIYGNITERYFKKHRNQAKKYIKTGVVTSQLIRELQEGKLESPITAAIQRRKLPEKRIAVFDTAFVEHTPLRLKDGVRFANDVLRLLDEMPDIGIIFKASRPRGGVPGLTPIYDKLENHDRCVLFYRWNEQGISAVEVIAESVLVISATYVSTTAEALGARKRAIYYDVASQYIGDRYYFNRFPNFVAHNYDELKELVHYWLYEVTDKDFEDFLNTYVKDEIDPYLDGKALTRLRRLLRE